MSVTILIYSMLIIFLSINLQNSAFGQAQDKNEAGEVQKLKEKVAELEKTISSLKEQLSLLTNESITDSVDSDESDLEKELAKELGVTAPEVSSQPTPQQTQKAQTPSYPGRRSLFQNMNPNISVIGTILGSGTSLELEDRNVDLSFEEGEFSFQAVVDPYAKADFFISFAKPNESTLTPEAVDSEEAGGGLEPEIEEAFVTILSLPFSTQLKAGKFRSKFGKINETHPHAYNFINLPLIYTNFFGAEGLNDEGASLSWLVPNSAFFQELTIQVTSGPEENASFSRADDNHLLYLAHLKNLFELNENTTMELGVTGLTGPHNSAGKSTQIYAADLTFKWKPIRYNRYKSFEFMNEFLVSKRNDVVKDVTSFGFYSFLRYQLAKRWFVGAMYDYSEFPEFDNFHHQAFSGILQFFTTEFQKFEIQYRYNQGDFFDNFSDFKVRAVFVIGAHGAHQY
ncbi:MAG: hypothetical protein ACE5JB_08725 [bacterium]